MGKAMHSTGTTAVDHEQKHTFTGLIDKRKYSSPGTSEEGKSLAPILLITLGLPAQPGSMTNIKKALQLP